MSDLTDRLRTRPTGDPYLHMMAHEAADEIDHLSLDLQTERAAVVALTRELANAKVNGVHSCHADCARDGCVNRRLRERVKVLRSLVLLLDSLLVDLDCACIPPGDKAEYRASIKAALKGTP